MVFDVTTHVMPLTTICPSISMLMKLSDISVILLCGPICGFLVIWLQVVMEPFVLFHHSVFYYMCFILMFHRWGKGPRCGPKIYFYTPDIRSMWGYIVFAFPFVRSFVHTFVRSSFRHRVNVFALKFIRPHILKTLWWISFIFGMMVGIGQKFLSAPSPLWGWPWGQGDRLRIFIKKSKFFVFKFI